MKKETLNNTYYFLRLCGEQFVQDNFCLHSNSTHNVLLLFSESGSARIELDKKEYVLDAGHMLFIHPRIDIRVTEVSTDFQAVVIGLPHVMKENATLQIDISFLYMLGKTPYWQIDEEFGKMVKGFILTFEYIAKDLDSDLKMDMLTTHFSLFMRVLYERSKHLLSNANTVSSITNRSLLLRFASLLHTHYREDHRVAFYADRLCVTPKYLTQVMKNTVGITPKDIIDRILAMESLHQLRNSNYSIQQISELLGFPDQSYFGRFFKRIYGISPSQFRANPNMDILSKLDKIIVEKYPDIEKFYIGSVEKSEGRGVL